MKILERPFRPGSAADERVHDLMALQLPLQGPWDPSYLERTRKPWLFVQGEFDSFGDSGQLRSFVETLSGPCEVGVIERANHFFDRQDDEAVEAVVDYIRRSIELPGAPPRR